jgi:hypothetical protein
MTRKVAEVVNRERNIGGERLAHGLAVVPGLGNGDLLEVLFDAVGDAVQHERALGDRRLAPSLLRGVCRVEGRLDVLGRTAADLAEHLPRDG